jgi:hypothetical protein
MRRFERDATPWGRVLIGLLVSSMAGACASSTSGATALVELEHRWVDALRTHDARALERILDDTFLDSTYRGELRTKQQVLSGPPAGGGYHSTGLEGLEVRVYGRTAVVTGVNVLASDPPAAPVRIRFTDVFVRRGTQWRAVSAQETLQSSP